MRTIKYLTIQQAKEKFKNLVFSHNWPNKIKEGAQFGMYEMELTNYNGQGASIKVIGSTPEEAEAMGLIVLNALKNDTELTGGDYDNKGCNLRDN